MPGRTYVSATGYRYGFNGKEHDSEWKGSGNSYDYGFRIYDPRICKFLSVDPLTDKYPELTPYQFASNTPIEAIDIDGLEQGSNKEINLNPQMGKATLEVPSSESFDQNILENKANFRQNNLVDNPPAPVVTEQFYFNPQQNHGPSTSMKNLTVPASNDISNSSNYADLITSSLTIGATNLGVQGSKFGSNFKIYGPTVSGNVFNGNQYVSVIKFSTIAKGLKVAGYSVAGIGAIGDMLDYKTGAIGSKHFAFNLSITTVSLFANPVVGIGLFALTNMGKSGREIKELLADWDRREMKKKNKEEEQKIHDGLPKVSAAPPKHE